MNRKNTNTPKKQPGAKPRNIKIPSGATVYFVHPESGPDPALKELIRAEGVKVADDILSDLKSTKAECAKYVPSTRELADIVLSAISPCSPEEQNRVLAIVLEHTKAERAAAVKRLKHTNEQGKEQLAAALMAEAELNDITNGNATTIIA